MIAALAQINSVIGDFEGNRRRILEALDRLPRSAASAALAGTDATPPADAAAPSSVYARPDLIVFPELSLCGYPPLDLLDQDSFVEASLASLRRLQRELPSGPAYAIGYVDRNRSGRGRPLVNAIAVIKDGAIVFTQAKTLLPTYDVFDEARYFEPAPARRIFEYQGERIGFAICEDIWWEAPPVPGLRYEIDPVKELLDQGATMLIVPSASPFTAGKLELRLSLAHDAAREGGIPLLYCNSCGADDSLVFDGRSFAVDASGSARAVAGWDEEVLFADTRVLSKAEGGLPAGPEARCRVPSAVAAAVVPESGTGAGAAPAAAVLPRFDRSEEIEKALEIGIRDYLGKCGFSSACLALSGGIDSAIVAILAARALGPDRLTCISMPSRYSSSGSVSDSEELCRRLGVRLETLAIEGPHKAFLELLEPKFEGKPAGLAEENLQARIRGAIAMTWSNKFGSLLLTTGNKSELAAGYCTLYGDMCGALDPIGDLLKTEVYALARSMNARARAAGGVEPMPQAIIDKAPSAELRPNQKDQDSLPPYDVLDGILDLYIVKNLSASEIVARGYESALVERVIRLVARAEFKRRQAAPVIKVSPRAFGMGRRIPIARKIHEA